MYAKILAVGAGGFVGALLRYGVSLFISKQLDSSFPWATFAVNIAGCTIIGCLMGLTEIREGIPAGVRLFLITGLIGSLTTFSTFSHESITMLKAGEFGGSMLNIGLNLVLGLTAVWAGHLAVTRI